MEKEKSTDTFSISRSLKWIFGYNDVYVILKNK